jgi:hypothetical protein
MIAPYLVPAFQKGFAWTSKLLLEKNFAGMWLDRESAYGGDKPWPRQKNGHCGGVFFYSTHAAWHDPMVFAFLSVMKMQRRMLAPMHEVEFRRYKSLRLSGLFGVTGGDGPWVEGMLEKEFKKNPETCLWVTPQGRFAPNEVAQPSFKSGLSRWSNIAGRMRVPVVVHYQFGSRPKPLIFVRMGKEVPARPKLSIEDDSERLRRSLNSEVKALLKKLWSSAPSSNDLNGFMRL